ncbi:CBS domain-containing protein [Nitrosopumilus sp.]|uniref:CBS domain-containing protein n=1 Tax=Nitrosopumilus sp. TaxID=2024843 RepID=UPI00247CBCED|nr:CBS domain-containing protein [Nitrosopumilus sp.]MCV0410428.1 CBS domain-containing protein [Nitrosopumilus sp.]
MNPDPLRTLVKDLMTHDVEMVHSEHTIQQAAKIMKNDGVGSVIVMKNKEPVGIMTERDFAVKVVVDEISPSTKISEIMTSPVIHISAEASVLQASDIMIEKKIRKIPVFDAGEISGIITATDILRFFRFSTTEQLKNTCPLHTDERLVKTELTDGTFRLYCSKCEEFFEIDE